MRDGLSLIQLVSVEAEMTGGRAGGRWVGWDGATEAGSQGKCTLFPKPCKARGWKLFTALPRIFVSIIMKKSSEVILKLKES